MLNLKENKTGNNNPQIINAPKSKELMGTQFNVLNHKNGEQCEAEMDVGKERWYTYSYLWINVAN